MLARVSVSPGADGMWRASLIVGRSAAPGQARVTATCVASAQAEGALVVYDPVAVTVTAELAMTGADTAPAGRDRPRRAAVGSRAGGRGRCHKARRKMVLQPEPVMSSASS